jgi:uncharacterized protein
MPPPSSPCVKNCVMDAPSGLCIGCGRTTEEIAAWPYLGEPERLKIMVGLAARLVEARARWARGGDVAAREER